MRPDFISGGIRMKATKEQKRVSGTKVNNIYTM